MLRVTLATVVIALASDGPAGAQIDPLLFLKGSAPNILVMLDTGNRMQRDAPTDPADPIATSNYYDPYVYSVSSTAASVKAALGLSDQDATYRRRYAKLAFAAAGSNEQFTTSWISVVTNRNVVANPNPSGGAFDARSDYTTFDAPTRLAIARAALYQAIQENEDVARFGLYSTRQNSPLAATEGNSGPVLATAVAQNQLGSTELASGRWGISTPTVAAPNGSNSAAGSSGSIQTGLRPDDPGANANILALLRKSTRQAGALVPAGQDDANAVDEPVQYMVDDLKSEAQRLITADVSQSVCRNTVAVLIAGGGEGTTAANHDPVGSAATLLTAIPGHRVPIVVIAIGPPAADVEQLRATAAASGGQYFEIARDDIDRAFEMQAFSSQVPGTVIVPEIVRAIDVAVQTAFQNFSDLNTAPFWSGPAPRWSGYPGSAKIRSSEYQVNGPIVATVNLENASDIAGTPLPLTIVNDKASKRIPQPSNVMVTSGFLLPGFDGMLRAFRVYKPQPDATQNSGFKFSADGTPLWVASAPPDPAQRNLYTALPDGTIVSFTTTNAAALAPLMNLTPADAAVVIDRVRYQPLGAVIDSTPAIMDPPSLDPPPDNDYPAYSAALKSRRSIVWVGTNRGILEGIDARTGVEVWGFIPLNLLPKLKTIIDGESVGRFDYLMDGSPRLADVKIDGAWKTYLIAGEGPGGTFYQTFDVTLTSMSGAVDPASDNIAAVLAYFADPARIVLRWEFPRYSVFDPGIGKYGDLAPGASLIEKTVGQTWSEPAVAQVADSSAPYVVLVGSGFLPWSTQHQVNRGDVVAGTTLYALNARTGSVLDARSVGSDGVNETVDDCSTNGDGCRHLKNALQNGPVATGAAGSLFVRKAYVGDLDGNLWRFDLGLDSSGSPKINALVKVYAAGNDQPIFSSLATLNVSGASQYLFFGTGSDLLPGTDDTTRYHLLGVLDTGAGGTKSMDHVLTKTAAGNSITADEKVSAYPAVAGDIVFFTTTTFKPGATCSLPDANLYAFTFTGGPAYDNSGDNTVTATDTPLVRTIAGQRATAPLIMYGHLAFGTGGSLELFGDSNDFNPAVGQAGVRILSWRDAR